MKAEQGTRLWLFQKKEEKAPWKKVSFSYANPYTHSLRRISRRVFCSVNMQIECENGGGQREVSCAISKRGRKEEEEEMVWRFHKGKKLPPFASSLPSFPAIFLFSSTSTSRCYSSPPSLYSSPISPMHTYMRREGEISSDIHAADTFSPRSRDSFGKKATL